MSTTLIRHVWIGLFLCICIVTGDAHAAGNFSITQAEDSITVADIKEHVNVLASDTFEGREAGSQGGMAAGVYLGEQYRKYKLAGGTSDNRYYQSFNGNYRNILGMIRGTDPVVGDEVVMVSAHYDHVGYGNSGNSRGPTGYIHNGADDNASGIAALIEVAAAISNLNTPPRRTILFALWDAEEKGLWGSQHWINSPTVPRDKVKMLINVDMIGRLRRGVLTCYGARTIPGLRRIISDHNHVESLKLDYTWELPDNSDHWPFLQRHVPAMMFHTGLHNDYHTPADDLDKLNYDGIRDITRLMFHVTWDLANREEITPFRRSVLAETVAVQKQTERGLPPRPSRLGVRWTEVDAPSAGVRVDQIRTGSAAARAGLVVGDVIVEVGGTAVSKGSEFLVAVLAAPSPTEFVILRGEDPEPKTISVALEGTPTRLGISWRIDPADPGCLVLTRVVPGSPAGQAGLRLNDRIYKIGEREVSDFETIEGDAFYQTPQLELQVERHGFLKSIDIQIPELPNR